MEDDRISKLEQQITLVERLEQRVQVLEATIRELRGTPEASPAPAASE
ncbi:MAG: hypothetical protein JWO36_932 [Myxococcales bacterium]|nr:hypothetical protein [Myxococcales bacterium]